MNASSTSLRDYVAHSYTLIRDIRPDSLRQYRVTVNLFDRWNGSPVLLSDLSEQLVSAWLRDYAATASPTTVRSKKVHILAIWRAASDDGLAREPIGRRIRRVKVPASIVTAWTRDEIHKLLETCKTMRGLHRCGMPRAIWWDLAVRVAWDSGLRWGDMVSLRVDSIAASGVCTMLQSKTGKPTTFRLSPSTMEALSRSLDLYRRDLVCPWPSSNMAFTKAVRGLVVDAQVRRGTWKWIRRGSGSDVESQADGAGCRHLGNTRRVFEQSYGDQTIIGSQHPAPRALEPNSQGPA